MEQMALGRLTASEKCVEVLNRRVESLSALTAPGARPDRGTDGGRRGSWSYFRPRMKNEKINSVKICIYLAETQA